MTDVVLLSCADEILTMRDVRIHIGLGLDFLLIESGHRNKKLIKNGTPA
jgi:hypothetical protein